MKRVVIYILIGILSIGVLYGVYLFGSLQHSQDTSKEFVQSTTNTFPENAQNSTLQPELPDELLKLDKMVNGWKAKVKKPKELKKKLAQWKNSTVDKFGNKSK